MLIQYKMDDFIKLPFLETKVSLLDFKNLKNELQLPIDDLVRFSRSNIIDRICNELEMWN